MGLWWEPQGKTARSVSGGLGGLECTDTSEAALKDMVEVAYALDKADYLEPGVYKVLTGPDVTGVIAHEAFGHTQEGDTCRYGRSCAPFKRDKKECLGNAEASIMNNAAVYKMGDKKHGQNGSHFFDDEGFLAKEHVILDKGYLGSPMNDLMSAWRTGSDRQSNGKRESWRRPIMARQTNTYFTPGNHTFDELLSMIDYGFVADQAHGGMEDPKGMRLTAGTEFLREVRDGAFTGRGFLRPTGWAC